MSKKEIVKVEGFENYIKEHATTIHGYTEDYVKELQQEIQQLKEQLRQRDSIIEEAIDMLNLIIPELWNINNNITYKLQAIRRALNKYKGDNK